MDAPLTGGYPDGVDPARKMATYDDLLALPEGVRAEVVGGEIVIHPAPLPRHGFVHSAVDGAIGVPFQHRDGRGGPGGWWILLEVDVRLSASDIVRPDVSGWRRSRLAEPWDLRAIDVVPDWVCEILSPSNAQHDVITKRVLYARHGVAYYWIVDPALRTLLALKLVDGAWVELGAFDDTSVARIAPFEAIEIEVGALFPPAT